MDRRRFLWTLAVVVAGVAPAGLVRAESIAEPPCCCEVSDDGERLRRVLDNSGVDRWWGLRGDVMEAQFQANRGLLVLAVVENPNLAKPGHIAIVRPDAMMADALLRDGPMLTQAGGRNALSIAAARAFRGHGGAWLPGAKGSVQFFAHLTNWAQLS